MKLRQIFTLALAALLVVGCSDDEALGTFTDISVDKSFVSLPVEGGDVTVTVQAADAWELIGLYQKITKNDDGTRDTTYTPLPHSPAWLSADKLSGPAGQSTLTLHAEATEAGREAEVCIEMNGHRQYIIVRQGSLEASEATCADVIAAPDGKTFRVTGTVAAILNTQYGNWDLQDETGTIRIYGTNDKDGKKANNPIDGAAGWGFEVGDIVTVEGPKTTYGSTIELVDVTVISITKSLLKVVTPEQTVSIEGGDIDVKLAYKGSGAYATLPADCDWVTITGEDYVAGKATLFETNPADTAIVHLHVAPNAGNARKATLSFSSSNADGQSTINWTLTQEAFTLPHGESADDPFTVEEAIAKCLEIGNTTDGVIYYAHGYISSIKEVSPSFGNATFNISDDGSDDNALTVFRSKWLENAAFTAEDQIGVGDEVVIRGKLVYYKDKSGNETPEFSGDVYVVSHKQAGPGSRLRPFTADEANDFIMKNLEVGQVTDDEYYIAGEIVNIAKESDFFNANYGNASFFIADDDDPSNDTFYVFRTLYLGNRKWVNGDTQIQKGDQVVVCSRLTKYQDKNGNIIPETFNGKIDNVSVTPYLYSLNGKKQ